jgi:hypothetical protein
VAFPIMSEKSTLIRIPETLRERLAAHGKFGESYADVISRILDEYDEMKSHESKV